MERNTVRRAERRETEKQSNILDDKYIPFFRACIILTCTWGPYPFLSLIPKW
jgi:hypothetical protein